MTASAAIGQEPACTHGCCQPSGRRSRGGGSGGTPKRLYGVVNGTWSCSHTVPGAGSVRSTR
jgi:hypothetical protein